MAGRGGALVPRSVPSDVGRARRGGSPRIRGAAARRRVQSAAGARALLLAGERRALLSPSATRSGAKPPGHRHEGYGVSRAEPPRRRRARVTAPRLQAGVSRRWDRCRCAWPRFPLRLARAPARARALFGRAFPLEENRELAFLRDRIGQARHHRLAWLHQDYARWVRVRGGAGSSGACVRLTACAPRCRRCDGFRAAAQRALEARLAAVSAAGLNLGSFCRFGRRAPGTAALANGWRVRAYRAASGRRRTDSFVYPFVLRYRRHASSAIIASCPAHARGDWCRLRERGRPAATSAWRHYWEVDAVLKDVPAFSGSSRACPA